MQKIISVKSNELVPLSHLQIHTWSFYETITGLAEAWKIYQCSISRYLVIFIIDITEAMWQSCRATIPAENTFSLRYDLGCKFSLPEEKAQGRTPKMSCCSMNNISSNNRLVLKFDGQLCMTRISGCLRVRKWTNGGHCLWKRQL